MQILSAEDRSVLSSGGWLATCTQEFREAFLSLGGRRTYTAGEYLYRGGERSRYIFGLIRGQIDVHLPAPNGEELVFPSAGSSKWFGLGDAMAGVPTAASAIAKTSSLIHCISSREFLLFLDEDPARYRAAVSHENEIRRLLQHVVAELVTSDGLERVARRLSSMALSGRMGRDSQIAISQTALAAMLGVSLPTVQRAFRVMKSLGIIQTGYGTVSIIDPSRLAALAEGHSAPLSPVVHFQTLADEPTPKMTIEPTPGKAE